MRHLIILSYIILLTASPLFAAQNTQSDNLTINEKLGIFLFEQLAKAQTRQAGREAEAEIWHYWFNQAPSKEIKTDLEYGRKRREAYDYVAAEISFDKVVAAAPNFAEGYNQRAFVRFLRENFSGALQDLEKALELEPRHFGAMSGMFHVLRLMNRNKVAFKILQNAVKIHPWIKERSALPGHMQPPRPKPPKLQESNKDIQKL